MLVPTQSACRTATPGELESVFDRVFGRDLVRASHAPYAVDVREEGDVFRVEAELPGFTREQIDVTLENNTLTIAASRQAAAETPTPDARSQGWLLRERRFNRFQRSFVLPNTIDESSVSARLENGVLEVTVSKRQEAKPRKIAVN